MRFLFVLFGALIVFASPGAMHAQTLTLTDSSLVYEKDRKKVLIKKMTFDTDFYGYDIVDENYIFFAYKRLDSADERAVIAVFNLENQKEKIIDVIRAARTTQFAYNRENGLAVFNGIDGIYTLKIQGFLSGLAGPKRLIAGENFYKVFWVDAKSFGYRELDEATRQVVTKYFTIR